LTLNPAAYDRPREIKQIDGVPASRAHEKE